jgi:hypothetical protein
MKGLSVSLVGFGRDSLRICPYCLTFCAKTPGQEVNHMETSHPEIIEDRLEAAGMMDELRTFRGSRY